MIQSAHFGIFVSCIFPLEVISVEMLVDLAQFSTGQFRVVDHQ